MSNFLKELESEPRLQLLAYKAGMDSLEQIIATPSIELLAILKNCTEHDVRKLKEAAAKIITPTLVPVSDLLTTTRSRISFGCPSLDRCSGGGVVTRGITEVCGAAGAGKSQLLLQLSLTVQLPRELGGLGKSVVYICTEGPFPSKRLFQMAKTFGKKYPEQHINYMGNVYVDHAFESDDLIQCVTMRLAKLMQTINIGLIVIDSVAAVFRVYTNYVLRAKHMRQIANALLHYADKYNCGVVCVNQMSAVRDRMVPCLGLVWSHLGRTRIKISKIPKQTNLNSLPLTIRKFEIVFAPETPNEFVEFLITEEGVVDVPTTTTAAATTTPGIRRKAV